MRPFLERRHEGGKVEDGEDMVAGIVSIGRLLADEADGGDELRRRQVLRPIAGRGRQFGESLKAHAVLDLYIMRYEYNDDVITSY